mmetsp:Transcript_47233/g.39870  ORF Transcript_47233/g.39870 Transcript_47233/m.39870 type:complete len:342 (+) Transcript_47233:508-1533(+)
MRQHKLPYQLAQVQFDSRVEVVTHSIALKALSLGKQHCCRHYFLNGRRAIRLLTNHEHARLMEREATLSASFDERGTDEKSQQTILRQCKSSAQQLHIRLGVELVDVLEHRRAVRLLRLRPIQPARMHLLEMLVRRQNIAMVYGHKLHGRRAGRRHLDQHIVRVAIHVEGAHIQHANGMRLREVKARRANILSRAVVLLEALQRTHFDLHFSLIPGKQRRVRDAQHGCARNRTQPLVIKQKGGTLACSAPSDNDASLHLRLNVHEPHEAFRIGRRERFLVNGLEDGSTIAVLVAHHVRSATAVLHELAVVEVGEVAVHLALLTQQVLLPPARTLLFPRITV